MDDRRCPSCRADLEDDLLDSTGSAVCPFCGSDVSALYEVEAATGDDGFSLSMPSGGGSYGGTTDEAPPHDSRIQVAESSDDRFVAVIPPGGKSAGGIGCFAVAWNGFMTLFTGLMLSAMWGGQDDVPGFAFVMLGLFWLVGIGFAYAWVRMSFTRTFLLLERDRLAVQRVLFGRKWVRETYLNAETRARLETSYSENDEPVYHVQVDGESGSEKFGLRLGDDEKQWFVRRINGFLHGPSEAVVEGGPDSLRFEREQKITEDVAALPPSSLPTNSPIRIDDQFVDGVRFSLPLLHGGMRTGCTWGCGGVGLAWVSFCSFIAFVAPDWPSRLVPIFIAVPGTIFLIASLAFRWGRIEITVDGHSLDARWHVGPFGWSKSMPITTIRAIGLGTTMVTRTNGETTHTAKGCIVRTDTDSIPLTGNHGEEIGRQVAGLVRHELERRGIVLEEVGGV